jgi:hypothetical protein
MKTTINKPMLAMQDFHLVSQIANLSIGRRQSGSGWFFRTASIYDQYIMETAQF